MLETTCTCEPMAVRPLIGLLHQLFDLIETLTDDEYARKPVGVVESSIGGHVRHNLDHIEALLNGLPSGQLCYDHRDRGTNVERDRLAALGAILRLEGALLAFPWSEVPAVVVLDALVAPDLPPVQATTSAERELAFVVSHTIHHNALVRVMVKWLGRTVPADFGYAPSTIARR
ncbi:DinB family protein [Frigoriglobus tundricola]|uniref:DinB-like domain-containing protein n=1 Tax=Frigoriglobus tundricola TaxID=2774151 RepID=A0A6M5YGD2_9BACT|nr:DinB family protein [Frigoriglobus tundricola]QJW93058.1 hypothetical protein FTUN_0558 [Frigoriglobus tundricola]